MIAYSGPRLFIFESFESAWRNQMIASNHATGDYGNIRQIMGDLPTITNPSKFRTTKGFIGQSTA